MRRSRSSSRLRSNRAAKEDVVNSFIDSINVTLRYLANNTMNKDAITAIANYVKERVDELELFGVMQTYDSSQFKSVNDYIASYTVNKNQATAADELFKVKPMKLSALTKIDFYSESMKNVWNISTSMGSVHFEKYVQNKLIEVLGFYGSPVILRDHKTAELISEFYLAQQNHE